MKNKFFKLLVLSAIFSFISCEDELVTNNTYTLDEENSTVEWKGYSPNGFHDGSFSVTGNDLLVVNGRLTGGTFTIPIVSIQNFDLPEEVKPVLLNHLKSSDFFNIAIYPTATFKISKVQPGIDPAQEDDFMVTGYFTMLGQTHPVVFPTYIEMSGNELNMTGSFKIDRTKWGMNYAADPALGDHHILPEVEIIIDISAQKLF